MNRSARTALLIACLSGFGCDDTPAPPPPELVTERPAEEPAAPARPTTQELLTGPRNAISLGVLPLTVQAPAGWGVNSVEGTNVVLLEGPTPAGQASIQLANRMVISSAKLDALVNGAKGEMKQNPDSMKMVELREPARVGGVKVLERQRVGKAPRPVLAEEDGTKASAPFSWTITAFVPRGGSTAVAAAAAAAGTDYEAYELNFIGLTADQYETDKALLREIIDSLAVDAAGAGATSVPAAR